MTDQLRQFHTGENCTFGQFGADITLLRCPDVLNIARLLANRGVFLEVLPVLRLCLEMVAWCSVANFIVSEDEVRRLTARACVSKMKAIYESAGNAYGYLSKFSHWEHEIHTYFLSFEAEQVAVVKASCKHRAMSLTLCLLVLDIVIEVTRHLYPSMAGGMITTIQGAPDRTSDRRTHQLVARIVEFSKCPDLQQIQSLLR